MFLERVTLNLRGRLFDLTCPKVMAVLNCTPDSFYDGGKFSVKEQLKHQIDRLVAEGADIIDVGGMSSRPGARVITAQEEWDRVAPALEYLAQAHPQIPVSIDTVHGTVARRAVALGAVLVNDISAGSLDDTLLPTVAELRVPYCLMHMQGRPETMQQQPHYDDVVVEVLDFFIAKMEHLNRLDIVDVVIDVGFGFGKTIAQNYRLLNNLSTFRQLEVPILAGLSRKSMIYQVLETNAEGALNGTSVLHFKALQQGARLLRVHDVQPAKEVIKLWETLNKYDA